MLSRGQFLAEKVDETRAVELLMRPGDVSFHHTMAFHASGPNQSGERRIGFGISYIPTKVRHIGETRLTATLVRGQDRYGHFDLDEPVPQIDAGEAELQAHAASIARYWKASESIPEMKLGH
jgi:ectoine hydroxylase-related dioxygenase (phytanoyl-CoA dioxygenase family)